MLQLQYSITQIFQCIFQTRSIPSFKRAARVLLAEAAFNTCQMGCTKIGFRDGLVEIWQPTGDEFEESPSARRGYFATAPSAPLSLGDFVDGSHPWRCMIDLCGARIHSHFVATRNYCSTIVHWTLLYYNVYDTLGSREVFCNLISLGVRTFDYNTYIIDNKYSVHFVGWRSKTTVDCGSSQAASSSVRWHTAVSAKYVAPQIFFL